MSNFMVTFKGNQGKKLHVPEAMIKDLIWWKKQLSNSFYYCQLQPLPHVVDLGVYVDASTDWGISIVIGQEWAAFQLIPDWKSQLPDWDICWLETIVVEFTLLFLIAKGYSNTRLLVRSDNQGTIGTFIKAHSTNKWINLFICRMTESLNSSGIFPELIYVNTKDNLADPISLDSMDNHLIVNADISLTFPFFTYMGDDSKPKPLTKKEFLDACSKIWREAGMPPIKGHSFQIGRAVELLLVGVSPETVAKIRGWDSLAFLLYWRKCEEILPALTTDAYQKQALENLITTINAWADHLTMSATEFA
uniref:Uncharacterized protein n=1 Tax=Moniliophthora roreri TaxID=221103 RepID=A0A0W0GFF6_MONRR